MNKKFFFMLIIYSTLIMNAQSLLDIKYKNSDGTYTMIIEIPAGTNEKWEVSKESGIIELDLENGKKRVINFLPYPGNYGFIPQTKLNKERGGDGDPIDVLLIGNSLKRGSIVNINIIGGLDFLDRGKRDTKLIAIFKNGILNDIDNIEELFYKYPNILSIIKLWFEGYKGFQKMQFLGYISKYNALEMVENAHKCWK